MSFKNWFKDKCIWSFFICLVVNAAGKLFFQDLLQQWEISVQFLGLILWSENAIG